MANIVGGSPDKDSHRRELDVKYLEHSRPPLFAALSEIGLDYLVRHAPVKLAVAGERCLVFLPTSVLRLAPVVVLKLPVDLVCLPLTGHLFLPSAEMRPRTSCHGVLRGSATLRVWFVGEAGRRDTVGARASLRHLVEEGMRLVEYLALAILNHLCKSSKARQSGCHRARGVRRTSLGLTSHLDGYRRMP